MVKKISLLVVTLIIGLSAVSFVHAQSVSDLQAQITALLGQIKALQQQLANQSQSSTNFCYTFNNNLSVGSSGNDVAALQTALTKEGFTISSSDTNSDTFGESTASAVSGFQEKYSSDVLKPFGLNYGTGFAGKGTRAKLNALYGCNTTNPPVVAPPRPTSTHPVIGGIIVTSPAAGDSWYVGNTYKILWNSGTSSDVKVSITLAPPRLACLDANPPCMTAQSLVAQIAPYTIIASTENDGSYEWTIPTTLSNSYIGNQQITVQAVGGSTYGRSGSFMIYRYQYQNQNQNASGPQYQNQNQNLTETKAYSVTSPESGDRWTIGQTYTIKWSGSDSEKPITSSGKVSISLSPVSSCQSTSSGTSVCLMLQVAPYVIATNLSNSGYYQWTISKDLQSAYVGRDQIIVTDASTGKSYVSGPFYVVSALAASSR